jgi:heptosyltransferase-2
MKILIVGPSWVGDMVMAQSLFKALQAENRAVRLHVLAPAWSRPLLDRMPEVERAIDLPFGHGVVELKSRREFAENLRAEAYDQAIVLPNSMKSALIPFWAGIPRRTGWRGEMRYGLINDMRVLDEELYPLMVERFVALACTSGALLPNPLPRPRLVIDEGARQTAVDAFSLSPGRRPVLALCPGAEFGNSKRWPEASFAELARVRIEAGYQVWIFGSERDQPVSQAVIDALPVSARAQCVDLAGRTSLAEAIDLMSLASTVVSNDSGLMHVAAALDRPLVAVYGSSSPAFTPPMGTRVRIETAGLECSPCFQRECPLGHGNCMKQLSPSRVIDAVMAVSED